jgi:hypothetical protein
MLEFKAEKRHGKKLFSHKYNQSEELPAYMTGNHSPKNTSPD